MQASDTPFKTPIPFANDPASRNTIPTASQIGVTAGAASLTDGFPPLTRTPIPAGGVPPFGKDMNGAIYQIAAIARWLVGGGRFAYDNTWATSAANGYPAGAVLMSADGTGSWRNVTDNNTTNPDTGGAGWVAASPAGPTGDSRNARIVIPAASATATYTADELVVSTALGGQSYRLGSVSQAINLATTGAGGMDTGAAPNNGYVAWYIGYNPVTNTRTVFGQNTTSIIAPEVYGGANRPAGFTATALVAVLPTNGSGQFQQCSMIDRTVNRTQGIALNSSSAQASLTSLSIGGFVPQNAKKIGVHVGMSNATNAASFTFLVAPDAIPTGLSDVGIYSVANIGNAVSFEVLVVTPQTIFYSNSSSAAGTLTFTMYIYRYTF